MYLSSFLEGMIFYGPIATLYRKAAGIGIFEITLIESISLALMILLELPWGIVADRIGYRTTRIVCAVLAALSKIVFWQASGFGLFLLERILISVYIAGLSGVDASILYLSAPEGKSHEIYSRSYALGTAGLLTASLVYSFAISGEYRTAAFLTVLSYGASAVLSLFLQEVHPQKQERISLASLRSTLRTTLSSRALMQFLIGAALLNETHQTLTVFLAQLQYVKCGFSQQAIGIIYTVLTVCGLFGSRSANITEKLGMTRTAVSIYACMIIACLLLGLLGIHAWITVPAVILLRLAFSLFQPLASEIQNRAVSAGDRATILSIQSLVMDGIGVGTNLAFGRIADLSLSGAFLTGGAFCAAGLILLLSARRGLHLNASE